MNKQDYQNSMREYIDSLEAPGTIATAEQWHTWIREEATEKEEEITDEEIDWLIEVLENDGYVISENEILIDDMDDEYIGSAKKVEL